MAGGELPGDPVSLVRDAGKAVSDYRGVMVGRGISFLDQGFDLENPDLGGEASNRVIGGTGVQLAWYGTGVCQ